MAQATFDSDTAVDEQQRRAALKALADANAILAEAWHHLELAPSLELELAHELRKAKGRIHTLERELRAMELQKQRYERKAAETYAELVDAKHEIDRFRADLKKSNKLIDKLATSDFSATVDTFTSNNRIKKHKPGGI